MVAMIFTIMTTLAVAPVAHAAETFITIESADGTAITAVYVPPVSSTSAVPAIVILHGCGGLFTKSGKIGKRERQWMDLFIAEGWAVLLPDSFGPRGQRSVCTSKARSITPKDHRQFDALGALRFLQSQSGIDPERIALTGWSNGAMTGLYAIMTGGPTAPATGVIDFRTAVLFYPGCVAIGKEYPNYTTRIPTLIQHGADDNWTLPAPCKRLAERTGIQEGAIIEIDIYAGAVHGFDHPSSELKTRNIPSKKNPNGRDVWVGTHPESRQKAIDRTMTWLRAHLKN